MKKLIVIALVVVLAITAGTAGVLADKPQQDDGTYKGNGAPSGPHFTLNIIGKDNAKKETMDCGNGHRIFVPLEGKSKIWLEASDDPDPQATPYPQVDKDGFWVEDCTAWGDGAKFYLPNPDPNNDGVTRYAVFMRVLGKPGGKVKMQTCATDTVEGGQQIQVCSDLQIIEVRDKGKMSFSDVSAELLYIYAWIYDDAKDDWEYQRLPLFDDELEDYFWQYDNNGLRIAQLRFYYYESSEVPEAGDIEHLAYPVPDREFRCEPETVKIGAFNFSWDLAEVDNVDFGDDITVGTLDLVNGGNKLAVPIEVGCTADLGWRWITVTFTDGRTLTAPFKVEAALTPP
jgi:hypothetical protein